MKQANGGHRRHRRARAAPRREAGSRRPRSDRERPRARPRRQRGAGLRSRARLAPPNARWSRPRDRRTAKGARPAPRGAMEMAQPRGASRSRTRTRARAAAALPLVRCSRMTGTRLRRPPAPPRAPHLRAGSDDRDAAVARSQGRAAGASRRRRRAATRKALQSGAMGPTRRRRRGRSATKDRPRSRLLARREARATARREAPRLHWRVATKKRPAPPTRRPPTRQGDPLGYAASASCAFPSFSRAADRCSVHLASVPCRRRPPLAPRDRDRHSRARPAHEVRRRDRQGANACRQKASPTSASAGNEISS